MGALPREGKQAGLEGSLMRAVEGNLGRSLRESTRTGRLSCDARNGRSISPHPVPLCFGLDIPQPYIVITLYLQQGRDGKAMKAHVVRIGNSRGIRIPKSVIEQCQLHGAVDLIVQQGQLVVRSADKARAGWDQAFEQMHRHGDDQLLDPESLPSSAWDRKDWAW